MDPIVAILWIGVVVFGGASLVALLTLAGILNVRYEKLLVGTLVTQIVIAGGSVFGFELKKSRNEMRLPVAGQMLIEQAAKTVVYDGTTPIYIRSPDVSRANRFADVEIDQRDDFTTKAAFRLKAGVPQTITVGQKRYRIGFGQMGEIDPDPTQAQSQSLDFVFFSIERGQ